MSILIKGMEMPKDNTVLLRIYPKDKLNELYVEQLDIDGDTLNEYWAVPVPPHGALMDRDEFFAACPELVDGYKTITDDLVVIPAEEGE